MAIRYLAGQAMQLAVSILLSVQVLALRDPAVALNSVLETEALREGSDLRGGPLGDLPVAEDSDLVKAAFDHSSDAFDTGEVVDIGGRASVERPKSVVVLQQGIIRIAVVAVCGLGFG